MQAAEKMVGHSVHFYGAGRTDQGVHALGQVAHADFEKPWPPESLRMGLNFYLKNTGVIICAVTHVAPTFHARFNALWRRYVYRILQRPSPSVLEDARAWWIGQPLVYDMLVQGAQRLCGTHDFSSFRNKDCQSASPIKTLDHADVKVVGQEWHITFQARSFLHRQVRMMVGVLVWLGRNRGTLEDLDGLLHGAVYPANAAVAPACGLYLKEVGYPADSLNTVCVKE